MLVKLANGRRFLGMIE